MGRYANGGFAPTTYCSKKNGGSFFYGVNSMPAAPPAAIRNGSSPSQVGGIPQNREASGLGRKFFGDGPDVVRERSAETCQIACPIAVRYQLTAKLHAGLRRDFGEVFGIYPLLREDGPDFAFPDGINGGRQFPRGGWEFRDSDPAPG